MSRSVRQGDDGDGGDGTVLPPIGGLKGPAIPDRQKDRQPGYQATEQPGRYADGQAASRLNGQPSNLGGKAGRQPDSRRSQATVSEARQPGSRAAGQPGSRAAGQPGRKRAASLCKLASRRVSTTTLRGTFESAVRSVAGYPSESKNQKCDPHVAIRSSQQG